MTQKLNVHFLNRGYDTDYGIKTVKMISLAVCEFTGRPQAKVESPFGIADTLVASFEGQGWVCDLD